MTAEGVGVVRIDAGSGAITGSALDGADVVTLLSSPDGQAVYAQAPANP